MTNQFELEKIIRQNGFSKRAIAKQLGISEQSLLNKMTNKTEFKSSEISKLVELLHIENDNVVGLFFNHSVNNIHDNGWHLYVYRKE